MGCKMTLVPSHTVALCVGVLMVMIVHLQSLEAQQQPLVKGLSWKFYESKCPKLESIIRKQMEKVIKKDVGLAASLLRVHFHDCFVQVYIYSPGAWVAFSVLLPMFLVNVTF